MPDKLFLPQLKILNYDWLYESQKIIGWNSTLPLDEIDWLISIGWYDWLADIDWLDDLYF